MLLGNARLILGTQQPSPVGESIPLDLTKLNSVRAFTTSIRDGWATLPSTHWCSTPGWSFRRHRPNHQRLRDDVRRRSPCRCLLFRLLLPVLANRRWSLLTTSGTPIPPTTLGWRRRVTPTRSCWRTPIEPSPVSSARSPSLSPAWQRRIRHRVEGEALHTDRHPQTAYRFDHPRQHRRTSRHQDLCAATADSGGFAIRAWRVPGLPARLTRSQAGLSNDFATLPAKRRAPKFSAMLFGRWRGPGFAGSVGLLSQGAPPFFRRLPPLP